MPDKTQLEIDIEKKEQVRKPKIAFILIIFLSVGLVVLGIYTIKLKQELSFKEHEILLIKHNCNNEKTELLNKIKGLSGKEPGQLKSLLEPASRMSRDVIENKKTE